MSDLNLLLYGRVSIPLFDAHYMTGMYALQGDSILTVLESELGALGGDEVRTSRGSKGQGESSDDSVLHIWS